MARTMRCFRPVRARIRAWRKPRPQEGTSCCTSPVTRSTVSNPEKVYFPEVGITKLELVRYYLDVAEGALRGVATPADDAEAVRQRRRGRAVLPEARAREATAVRRDRDVHVPVGPSRRRVRGVERSGAGLGRQPRLHRAPSARGARDRHGSARRAAHRSRSGARRAVVADRRRREGRARGARRARPRRLAEDLRLARRAPLGPDRAGVAVRDGAPCRARVRARGRAARTGDRDRGVVRRRSAAACSSTTTRTRAIARRAARTRCARRPDARVSMPLSWDDFLACDPRDFTLRTVPALYRARGDAHAAIDEHAGRIDALLELADRARTRRGVEAEPKAAKAPKHRSCR